MATKFSIPDQRPLDIGLGQGQLTQGFLRGHGDQKRGSKREPRPRGDRCGQGFLGGARGSQEEQKGA